MNLTCGWIVGFTDVCEHFSVDQGCVSVVDSNCLASCSECCTEYYLGALWKNKSTKQATAFTNLYYSVSVHTQMRSKTLLAKGLFQIITDFNITTHKALS